MIFTRYVLFLSCILLASSGVAFPAKTDTQSAEYATMEELEREFEPLETGEIYCNCSSLGCGLRLKGKFSGICRTSGGCKKQKNRLPDDTVFDSYECVHKKQYVPPGRPLVCQPVKQTRDRIAMACCHDASFCSESLNVTLAETPESTEGTRTTELPLVTKWEIVLIGIVLLLSVLLIICGYLLCRRLSKKYSTKERQAAVYASEGEKLPLQKTGVIADIGQLESMIRDIDCSTTSKSGTGLPLLVQRTVARQIDLAPGYIGKGRFGVVRKGYWQGEEVAVKIFQSRDEASWFREVEVYQSTWLRNPNVLGFIASDNRDVMEDGRWPALQLWLVTEYHPNGSLYDFLERNTVTPAEMCKLGRSIANGLFFLHQELIGPTYCKPGIAHRDVKSKNILVKVDGTCCMADLGMAVRYSGGVIDLPNNSKIGTRRYLAPEVLNGSLNKNQFEAFKRADVYSLGLVLWELCRRTSVGGLEESYELPFFDMVPPDPTQEDMKKCVCDEKKRPTISNRWMSSNILEAMSRIMKECWAASPEARLPALRIKYSIDALAPDGGNNGAAKA